MNRKILKERAKVFLGNGRYFKALLYTVLIWIASFGFLNRLEGKSFQAYIGFPGVLFNAFMKIDISKSTFFKLQLLSLISIIFIVPIFSVALNRYYLRDPNKEEEFKSKKFLDGLEGNYWNIIKVNLILSLILFASLVIQLVSIFFVQSLLILNLIIIVLFGLLIYLAYKFYMISYILAEEPSIKFSDCYKKNNKLLEGNKFELFKLDISFFLWVLVGILIPGLELIIRPYMEATRVQAYMELRDKDEREKVKNLEAKEEYFSYEKEKD